MDTCGEYLDHHLEEHAHYYVIATTTLQIVNFMAYNMAVVLESSFMLEGYQYYKFFSLSLLLTAMAYFLWAAIHKSNPLDLFIFTVLQTICNGFMIFRDVIFLLYPSFFVTIVDSQD